MLYHIFLPNTYIYILIEGKEKQDFILNYRINDYIIYQKVSMNRLIRRKERGREFPHINPEDMCHVPHSPSLCGLVLAYSFVQEGIRYMTVPYSELT